MGSKIQSFLARFFVLFENPRFAFVFALILYFLVSIVGGSPFRLRDSSYFNNLADAFLHGQLYLRVMPKTNHDLSYFHGHYYLYWPPMPAIVLMPFVAIFGVRFSDVFFNVMVGSVNVAAVAALLRAVDRQGLIRLRPETRAMLVFFFAFGTVHVILALFGKLWYTAQLLGFLFITLAYLTAIQYKGWAAFALTGLWMGCAMLTRNHLLFTGIWPAYYLIAKHWQDRPRLYTYLAAGLFPVLVMGLLFLNYNYVRFGSPFELGIRYHLMDKMFKADYRKYGAFNIHYLPTNFYYQYVHYPLPLTKESKMGGSLFLLSPAFFYAFKGIFQGRRDANVLLWLASVLATSIPILLLMGTGWVQYGPRYALDFTVPLLLLTARGVQDASGRVLASLVALSVLQYIPGIAWFARQRL